MPWLSSLTAALALLIILVTSGGGGRRATAQSYGYDEEYSSKVLNALFGASTQSKDDQKDEMELKMETESLVMPHQYYNDFYDDLIASKRNDVHSAGCDCKVTNELIDLGNLHFPRYLMNAVCESRPALDAKCTHGSNCRPLEYKVKVLVTIRDTMDDKGLSSYSSFWQQKDPTRDFLTSSSEASTQLWQFRTVTVTAGCFCAK